MPGVGRRPRRWWAAGPLEPGAAPDVWDFPDRQDRFYESVDLVDTSWGLYVGIKRQPRAVGRARRRRHVLVAVDDSGG